MTLKEGKKRIENSGRRPCQRLKNAINNPGITRIPPTEGQQFKVVKSVLTLTSIPLPMVIHMQVLYQNMSQCIVIVAYLFTIAD